MDSPDGPTGRQPVVMSAASDRFRWVLWALSVADPLVRPSDAAMWRADVVAAWDDLFTRRVLGEVIAGAAAALPPDDPWRRFGAVEGGVRALWWGDMFPTDDVDYYGGQIVPVPSTVEASLLLWGLRQTVGRAEPVSAMSSLDVVDMVCRVLLARFRAHEPGIEVREFFSDVVGTAFGLVSRRGV